MSKAVNRRDAVTALAASPLMVLSCTQDPDSRTETLATVKEETPMINPVLSEAPLPKSGPMPTADPFLFCVHHFDDYPKGNPHRGPAASLAGRQMGQDFANLDGWNMYHGDVVPGFPRHPHRGFETVTIVKTGLIDHADSLGAKARYGDGDVQWLTAGDGINHAEMFPLLHQSEKNPTDFFQIWLNLPARSKRVPPHFKMFWNEQVPTHIQRDKAGRSVTVRSVAGDYFKHAPPKPPPNSWASEPDAHVGMLTIELEPNAQWVLPAGRAGLNRSLYVVQGALSADDGTEKSRIRYVLKPDVAMALEAKEDGAMLLLLEGKPIGEPVVQHGPFVMNSRDEIVQAFADYRKTQFGGWPWASLEPTHGDVRRRFAQFADGHIAQPT
jgi:quercetin 2,3-dioxygenase